MDWQSRLIESYLRICACWEQGLFSYAERMSNNKAQELTDQEVITIFVNGVMVGRRQIKDIYNFTRNHLGEWFPYLGTYEAFVRRLNQVADVFSILLEMLVAAGQKIRTDHVLGVIDSMPIMLANAKRSNRAKVAPDLANKGYCGSKEMFYYGVKIHVLASARTATIPYPEYLGLTEASFNDLKAFEQISPSLETCDVFADKAYADKALCLKLRELQDVHIATPVKLAKGQKHLDAADQLYSTAVSRIRQPIESFFNWIQEKTGLQIASKVRSTKGLLVHVFGRLSAAMMLLTENGNRVRATGAGAASLGAGA